MKILHKPEFVELMAKNNKLSKADAERGLNMVTDTISKVLSKGDKIALMGFGTFYVLRTKARKGRNPKTGATISIKASNRPAFRAGQGLKKSCN